MYFNWFSQANDCADEPVRGEGSLRSGQSEQMKVRCGSRLYVGESPIRKNLGYAAGWGRPICWEGALQLFQS